MVEEGQQCLEAGLTYKTKPKYYKAFMIVS